LTANAEQPTFDKLDNNGSNQARCDFQGTQGKSGFKKLLRGFAPPRGVDVNLLLPDREEDDEGANGRCCRDPGTCLFSKRSPNFPGKIQFIMQSAQIARDTFT
jgi:hypothetical protein